MPFELQVQSKTLIISRLLRIYTIYFFSFGAINYEYHEKNYTSFCSNNHI